MDSAIQRLNNQGQQEKWMDPFFTTLAGTTINKWKIRLLDIQSELVNPKPFISWDEDLEIHSWGKADFASCKLFLHLFINIKGTQIECI